MTGLPDQSPASSANPATVVGGSSVVGIGKFLPPPQPCVAAPGARTLRCRVGRRFTFPARF